MDLSNAALLIAAVYGITELVKAMLPANLADDSKIKAGLAIVISFIATFLVAATAWADQQVIGDVTLDQMSVADKILVAILVAGSAALVQRGLKAVTNIGVPEPSEIQKKALDAGAERLVAANISPNAGGSHPETPPSATDTSVAPPPAV